MTDSTATNHDVGDQHDWSWLADVNRMTLGDAALTYAAHGLAVFAMSPNTNVPMKGTHGHLDATTDLDVVRLLWNEHPNANIGINLERSGLYCVDVDPRNGGQPLESWPDWKDQPMPVGWTETTVSGGWHHVFDASAVDGARFRRELTPGVDVKYDGYVVVAPSWRFNRQYQVTVARPPARSPYVDGLVVKGTRTTSSATAVTGRDDGERFDWSVLRELSIEPGAQDATMQAAAGWLREFDAPDEFALPLLYSLMDRFENQPGRREWTTEAVDDKWERAKRDYEPNQRDRLEVPVALQEFVAGLGPQLTSGQKKALAREADQRWARRALDEREAAEARGPRVKRDGAAYAALDKPRPVLPGRLAAEVNLLGGPSEAGKSLLARDWALEVANSGRNVLWVASEGMDDFDERWEAHPLWSDAVAARLFVLDEPVMIVHDREVDWLLEEYQEERPALVVFDLIYDMGIKDDNSFEYLNPMFRGLKRLSAAWDAATLALGHNKHGNERRFRGSSSWRQRCYVEWHMADNVLSCEKYKIGRKPTPRAYAVNFPTITWIELGQEVDDDARLRVIQQHVAEFPDLSGSERARQLAPVLGLSVERVRSLVREAR